ncbi:MAG: hypothetical protein COA63_008735 [Methylophaga sp.]|nr:hypothetical protein [Methylophaga sp.]
MMGISLDSSIILRAFKHSYSRHIPQQMVIPFRKEYNNEDECLKVRPLGLSQKATLCVIILMKGITIHRKLCLDNNFLALPEQYLNQERCPQ